MTSLEIAQIAKKALDDKMGMDIQMLDISKLSSVADYFVIASGSSKSQLAALADHVDMKLAKQGVYVNHVEGVQSGLWLLMDYGNVIIHIFHKDQRKMCIRDSNCSCSYGSCT